MSTAMRSMIDREFCLTERYKAQQLRALREGAHPDILEFEKRFITRLRKQGVPLFAVCLNRSASQQNSAFRRGYSKARAGQSAHNYGMAVDIIHGVKAYDLHRDAWRILSHIGKEVAVQAGIGIVSGADWKFWDPAHWELREWKTLSRGMTPWEPSS